MADSAVIQVVINPAWVEAHLSEWLEAVIREAKAEGVEAAQDRLVSRDQFSERTLHLLDELASEYRRTPDQQNRSTHG